MVRLLRSLTAIVLVVSFLGGMSVWGAEHGETKINVNTADAAALEALPGIGPARAAAIIEYREQMGEFTTVEDLQKVPGIGEKTLEDLKDKVTVGDQMTTGE